MYDRSFPFSLLSLLAASTVTAGLLGLIVALQPSARTAELSATLVVELVACFPLIVIWTSAFLILIQRWRRHPGVSKCALLGMSGLLMLWGTGQVLGPLYPRMIATWTSDQVLVFSMIWTTGQLVIRAACWWLIIVAVLGWRHTASVSQEVGRQLVQSRLAANEP